MKPRTPRLRQALLAGAISAAGLGLQGNALAQQPFVGEIACGGWDFCPARWLACDGSLVPIAEYETLFQLIGTTFGGDGQSTFAVPDLRGRTMVHQGNGFVLGQVGGQETVTVTSNTMPAHSHAPSAHDGSEKSASPTGKIAGRAPASAPVFKASGGPTTNLHPAAVGNSGGAPQPHNNLQPYLVNKCCISMVGIFPSPT